MNRPRRQFWRWLLLALIAAPALGAQTYVLTNPGGQPQTINGTIAERGDNSVTSCVYWDGGPGQGGSLCSCPGGLCMSGNLTIVDGGGITWSNDPPVTITDPDSGVAASVTNANTPANLTQPALVVANYWEDQNLQWIGHSIEQLMLDEQGLTPMGGFQVVQGNPNLLWVTAIQQPGTLWQVGSADAGSNLSTCYQGGPWSTTSTITDGVNGTAGVSPPYTRSWQSLPSLNVQDPYAKESLESIRSVEEQMWAEEQGNGVRVAQEHAANFNDTATQGPGRTQNDQPWKVATTDGLNVAGVAPANTSPLASQPASVVALSPNSIDNQGLPNTLANAWPVVNTDGVNGIAAVKPASTPPNLTDPSLVVSNYWENSELDSIRLRLEEMGLAIADPNGLFVQPGQGASPWPSDVRNWGGVPVPQMASASVLENSGIVEMHRSGLNRVPFPGLIVPFTTAAYSVPDSIGTLVPYRAQATFGSTAGTFTTCTISALSSVDGTQFVATGASATLNAVNGTQWVPVAAFGNVGPFVQYKFVCVASGTAGTFSFRVFYSATPPPQLGLGASTFTSVNITSTTAIGSPTSTQRVLLDALFLFNGGTAQSLSLIEGTGSTCGTGTTTIMGGSAGTAAMLANQGFVLPRPVYTQVPGDNLCVVLSGSTNVSGTAFYTIE